MHTLWHALGVCLGNSMWLGGMIMFGLGVLAVRAKKESVLKMVGVMSMLTGGQPKGAALKLKGLVDPVERQKSLGHRLLVVAVVLLLFGSTMVVKCSGTSASCCRKPPCGKPCPQMKQMQPPPLPPK
jgi:hypothetical protein